MPMLKLADLFGSDIWNFDDKVAVAIILPFFHRWASCKNIKINKRMEVPFTALIISQYY